MHAPVREQHRWLRQVLSGRIDADDGDAAGRLLVRQRARKLDRRFEATARAERLAITPALAKVEVGDIP